MSKINVSRILNISGLISDKASIKKSSIEETITGIQVLLAQCNDLQRANTASSIRFNFTGLNETQSALKSIEQLCNRVMDDIRIIEQDTATAEASANNAGKTIHYIEELLANDVGANSASNGAFVSGFPTGFVVANALSAAGSNIAGIQRSGGNKPAGSNIPYPGSNTPTSTPEKTTPPTDPSKDEEDPKPIVIDEDPVPSTDAPPTTTPSRYIPEQEIPTTEPATEPPQKREVDTLTTSLTSSVTPYLNSKATHRRKGFDSLIDAFRRGVTSFSGMGSGATVNKATAGIIAAAAVTGGGAVAGGVTKYKKGQIIRFTPKDWEALGPDLQQEIEKLMKKVGFSDDEIETFKHSKFKVNSNELKEHASKILMALDSNPSFDEEIVKLYNYSFIDDKLDVSNYLIFITMIIDGKNMIDDYNMYNVINQSITDVDDADFIYNGKAMEDYFDDSLDEEISVINNPIEKKEDSKEEPENENQEWLKGIGLDE